MFIFVFLLVAAVSADMGDNIGIPGGYTKQNPNDKEYMDLAWKIGAPAISKHESNNGEFALVPVQILSAKTQVVSGFNTDLEIKVGASSCAKTAQLSAAACPANANGPTQTYRIVIYQQPWTNTVEVTKIELLKKII